MVSFHAAALGVLFSLCHVPALADDCSLCPSSSDYFDKCPGLSEDECYDVDGCEWCEEACAVECTCWDTSDRSLYAECEYDKDGAAQNKVTEWDECTCDNQSWDDDRCTDSTSWWYQKTKYTCASHCRCIGAHDRLHSLDSSLWSLHVSGLGLSYEPMTYAPT